MQVAHPLVAAGVDQHSDFRSDPLGRLTRTLNTTLAVVFGSDRDASAAVDRMNRIHARVTGTSERGRAYRALDPGLLLWVQATLVLTSLRLYEAVMGRLPRADREAYWEETKPVARMLGIPGGLLPATIADLEAYEMRMIAREIVPDRTSLEVARGVLRPLGWLPEIAYWPGDAITAALLPAQLRDAFGLRYGAAERRFVRAAVIAVRLLRRVLPAMLTVVPQARRYERASHPRGWP
jgi:uncharacterized protein (DUF2236 family)